MQRSFTPNCTGHDSPNLARGGYGVGGPSRAWPPFPPLSGYLIRTCLHKMHKDKTCSRDDMVVAEMLQTAPEEAMDLLSDTFRLRLLNDPSCDNDPG